MMNKTIARKLDGGWLPVVRGVLLAVALTAGLVAVFALLISLFTFSDSAVRAVNQLIKLLAIFFGARSAVRPGSHRAIVRGAAVGLLYMAAGVLVYALLTGQPVSAYAYLADLAMGVAAGGLVGMLRGKKSR